MAFPPAGTRHSRLRHCCSWAAPLPPSAHRRYYSRGVGDVLGVLFPQKWAQVRHGSALFRVRESRHRMLAIIGRSTPAFSLHFIRRVPFSRRPSPLPPPGRGGARYIRPSAPHVKTVGGRTRSGDQPTPCSEVCTLRTSLPRRWRVHSASLSGLLACSVQGLVMLWRINARWLVPSSVPLLFKANIISATASARRKPEDCPNGRSGIFFQRLSACEAVAGFESSSLCCVWSFLPLSRRGTR